MRVTTRRLLFAALLLFHLAQTLAAQGVFDDWRLPNGEWYESGEAMLFGSFDAQRSADSLPQVLEFASGWQA